MPTNDSTQTPAQEAPAEQQTRAIFDTGHRGWDVTVYETPGPWFVADGVFGGFHLVDPGLRFENPAAALGHIRVAIDLEELRLFGKLRPDHRDAATVARQAMAAELDDHHDERTRRRVAGAFRAVDVNDPDLPAAVKGGR